MINALLEGMVLGFTLAFLIGPAFFSLLQTSINKGMYTGSLFAIGISLSDVVLIFLTSLGVTQIAGDSTFQLFFGTIGSIVLVSMGVYTYSKKTVTHQAKEINIHIKNTHPSIYILKGFILNFANPFVWIFWLTIAVTLNARAESTNTYIIFFIGTIATVFLTDILKCFIAGKIKTFLSNKMMFLINRGVGILLILFGLILLVRVVLNNYSA